jgi:hypothetical protein
MAQLDSVESLHPTYPSSFAHGPVQLSRSAAVLVPVGPGARVWGLSRGQRPPSLLQALGQFGELHLRALNLHLSVSDRSCVVPLSVQGGGDGWRGSSPSLTSSPFISPRSSYLRPRLATPHPSTAHSSSSLYKRTSSPSSAPSLTSMRVPLAVRELVERVGRGPGGASRIRRAHPAPTVSLLLSSSRSRGRSWRVACIGLTGWT